MVRLNRSLRGTTEHDPFEEHFAWRAGAISGFVATLAMGIAITLVDPGLIRNPIAGLYGMEGSLAVGWIAHLVHGTVFGIAFALVMADPSLTAGTRASPRVVVAGVVYGLVLAIAVAGVLMPIWLDVAGFEAAPDVPFITGPLVAWHVVYGAVLGGVFWLLDTS